MADVIVTKPNPAPGGIGQPAWTPGYGEGIYSPNPYGGRTNAPAGTTTTAPQGAPGQDLAAGVGSISDLGVQGTSNYVPSGAIYNPGQGTIYGAQLPVNNMGSNTSGGGTATQSIGGAVGGGGGTTSNAVQTPIASLGSQAQQAPPPASAPAQDPYGGMVMQNVGGLMMMGPAPYSPGWSDWYNNNMQAYAYGGGGGGQ
jgi:hypothetical protein